LVDLIAALERIRGIDRIRLSSIEISTVERAVIDYMAGSSKLCRYLHLPLQSGDDEVLRRMGRRYTSDEYRALIEYAARKIPRLGLGTDIIAGFPGEDDRAFRATEQLVRELPFNNLHVFPYSKRPGTRAAVMPGQLPEQEKKRRARRLIELGTSKRHAFAGSLVGSEVEVLVERVGSNGTGSGWTAEYIKAQIARPGLEQNQIVAFRPVRAEDGGLVGSTAEVRSQRPEVRKRGRAKASQ
jgi:threonylcarbamoyladenosine tRNA methylthiotransferase MtaB